MAGPQTGEATDRKEKGGGIGADLPLRPSRGFYIYERFFWGARMLTKVLRVWCSVSISFSCRNTVSQYDDTHGLTAKAGNTLGLCLDRLATALSPPVNETWTNPGYSGARGAAGYDRRKGSIGGETRHWGKRVDGSDFRRGGNRYGQGQGGGNSDRHYDSMKAYARDGGSSSRKSYRREGVLRGYGKDCLYDDRDRVDDDW